MIRHRLKQSLVCFTCVSVSVILLTYISIPIYKHTKFYENGFKMELAYSRVSSNVKGWNKRMDMGSSVLSIFKPNDDSIPWTSNYSTISHISDNRFKKDPWITSSGYVDFMNMPQIRYSPMFKNPCWHGSHGNGPLQDNRIHCIPYFYIIGVMKCGTTDIFQRLQLHPEVVFPGFKEAQWFAHDRSSHMTYGGKFKPSRKSQRFAQKYGTTDPRRLEFFIKMYDHAAERIQDSPTSLENGTTLYTHVTVDASPSNIFLNPNWWLIPGNENRTEPNITNLHCIRQLNPAARIIVMLRDPVKRLYSDYLFRFRFGGKPSKFSFHDMVRRATDDFNKCLTMHSFRWCIYNVAMWGNDVKFRLDLGMYAFYLREVWNVFNKEQTMVILLEDYHDDMRSTLQRVIEFLGLRQLNRPEMDRLLNLTIQNDKSYIRKQVGQMLPETESLLRTFYQPYNQDMAKLMENDKYLFQ